MAYIPDIAFDDKKEVGEKAFLLFAYYCKFGSMSKNRVKVKLETAAKFLGIAYENACRLNAILKKKGWLIHDGGEIILVKGWAEIQPQKLTKTTVFDQDNNIIILPKTDESISFQGEKTDENNSLVITKVEKTDNIVSFPQPDKPKTDENNSPKLTKTTVAYKEEPAFINQQEKEKDISNEISKKKNKSLPEFEIFPLPRSDVEPELWDEYLEYRAKVKKKPLTKRGFKNLVSDLQKLGAFDLNRRIEDAIEGKWQGLIFKEDFNGANNEANQTNRAGYSGTGSYNGQAKNVSKTNQGDIGESTEEHLASLGVTGATVLR